MIHPFSDELFAHYVACWDGEPVVKRWKRGPFWELPAAFCVLEFPPGRVRQMWTYATCAMSLPTDDARLELHLFSPVQNEGLVELLTVVAHYHRTGASLGLGHTVNFGRPWLPQSACDHGLISLPYLDGPRLEEFHSQAGGGLVECLWLVPITRAERQFNIDHGLEALERRLEAAKFNYLDPLRASVLDD
jgi:Suppressor of fused protein (SUFU)